VSLFVLTNVRMFAGGADLTGRSNKVELNADVEEKPTTNFASEGWKEVLGGIKGSALGAEGQWEAGDAGKVDDQMWAGMGAVNAYTVCPHTADVGSVAWLLNAMEASYKLGGAVGDIAPWTSAASGSWPLSRGRIAHPPGTARTATGTGTAVELAAVGASEYLFATLHVLSVAGTAAPTITVKIQSDADAGFASATDQITMTAATAIGGEIKRTAGAIADTFYRAQWTITGTNPSFLFVAAFGIK
jgi:hypothetical protein